MGASVAVKITRGVREDNWSEGRLRCRWAVRSLRIVQRRARVSRAPTTGRPGAYPSEGSDSLRFLRGRLQRRGSTEAESTLLLFQKLFQADANFFVIEHFTTLDLRESFFDLADKPLVVP